MRIVALSDTHGHHAKLHVPSGDILIHAGDFTNYGKPKEVASFCKWFAQQPHKYKIVIPGNHSLGLDCNHIAQNIASQSIVRDYTLQDAFVYLTHSALAIEGVQSGSQTRQSLQFFFSAYTPTYGNWAFMLDEGALALKWAQIPADTQVLVTHGPPQGILDLNQEGVHCGSASLLQRVQLLNNLKLMLFGHIHPARGMHFLRGVRFANVAICNDINMPVNKPTVIDI